MAGSGPAQQQTEELLRELSVVVGEWMERWQAASGAGYSDTEEALFDTDDLLRTVEGIGDRWEGLRGDAAEELSAAIGEAIADLRKRLDELIGALDAGDFERLRLLSQAVELGLRRVDELREGIG